MKKILLVIIFINIVNISFCQEEYRNIDFNPIFHQDILILNGDTLQKQEGYSLMK